MPIISQKNLALTSVFIFSLYIIYWHQIFGQQGRLLVRNSPSFPLVKPNGITVSAVVFLGRRDRVKSLNCYLEVGESR